MPLFGKNNTVRLLWTSVALLRIPNSLILHVFVHRPLQGLLITLPAILLWVLELGDSWVTRAITVVRNLLVRSFIDFRI